MKTLNTNYQNAKTILFKTLLLLLVVGLVNQAHAQTESSPAADTIEAQVYVQGIVMDASGPLPGANIVLKNSTIGAVADADGKFKFNTALKSGAILVVSYLGYLPQEIVVDVNKPFIEVTMTEDEIIFIGDLNTDRIYKSKRTH